MAGGDGDLKAGNGANDWYYRYSRNNDPVATVLQKDKTNGGLK